MPRGLHGPRLMGVDMAGIGADDALIGFENGGDDNLIGLGAAGEKLNGGLGEAAGPADQVLGPLTVVVLSVSGGLLQVGGEETFQNFRMGPFAVVTFKAQHLQSSFL